MSGIYESEIGAAESDGRMTPAPEHRSLAARLKEKLFGSALPPAKWAALPAVLALGLFAPSSDMPRAQALLYDRGIPGVFAVRGMSYPSYHDGVYAASASDASLAALAATGANFIAIVPTLYSKTIHDDTFYATRSTEADGNVVKVISAAHALGLKVLLKPHVDPADGKPRAYYAPVDPDAWFRNYGAFLLHYAALAQRNHVEMFNIGCELDSLVGPRYRERWLRLIRSIRAVYHGPLIYASGGAGDGDVSFWDALDYIGVDAYNPLSWRQQPSVADLTAGWLARPDGKWAASFTGGRTPLDYYRGLWERYRKPVIFTEIGYKSIAGATAKPGDWKYTAPVDLDLQARAYEAFFEVWSRQSSWMKGAFFWNWEPEPQPERQPGGLAGYTPQNKPAGAVLSRWYRAMEQAEKSERPLSPALVAERP